MIQIPNKNWLTIEEVWAVLETAGLVPKIFGDEGAMIEDGLFAGGKWICDTAFAGDIRLKGCRAEPHDEGIGEPIDIPSEYFRRPRAIYGEAGISRLSWEETEEELRRDEKNQRSGNAEPDWDDVLISRESLVRALGKTVPLKSGDPGRPTSKQLYVAEFDRRSRAGKILSSLRAESEYLSVWLIREHPLQPQAMAGTIENRIRPLFRRSTTLRRGA